MHLHQLTPFSAGVFEFHFRWCAGPGSADAVPDSFISSFRQTANQKWKVPESTSHLVSMSDRFSGVPSSRQ